MKLPLALVMLLATTLSVRAAECPLGDIEKALSSSLENLKMIEREVTDVQSTEGGLWRIYREKDGRVHSIIRIDGGESGMGERRLSMVGRKAYGITVTRVDYMRHAFLEDQGPNATAARKTDYYYFCDGKLYLPPAEAAMFDVEAYKSSGEEAQKMMVLDKDVADFTKGLAR
jgi:hypothetical protein